MPEIFSAEVVGKRYYGSATELVLDPGRGLRAEPGQFMHVYCGGGSGRILRRPFSIFDVEGGTFSLLVKVVGGGTAWLARREVGEGIDCLGPLGRAFSPPTGPGGCVLVAGGTGIAPLHYLARVIAAGGMESVIYWGIEHGDDYRGLPEMLQTEMELRIASEDGSLDFRGSVIDLLDADPPAVMEELYACGPKGMLVCLAETFGSGRIGRFQVSLEEYMACGVGACRGCAVPAASPGGGYLAACKDGPVFDGREIDWMRIRGSIPG